LTRANINALGDRLIRSPGLVPRPIVQEVQIGHTLKVTRRETRIIVCFSVTCCKERNDFEPAGVLGANRIYPHVMVMSSEQLKTVTTTIRIVRDGSSPHAGAIPGSPDMMLPDIGPIWFNDANDVPSLLGTPGLPFWDRFFTHYDLDPFASGATSVVMVDPSRGARSGIKQVVLEDDDGNSKYVPISFEKVRGQGEFDNIHMAPKMAISATARVPPGLRTDKIAMAPFCVHDCLHMHTRWGKIGAPNKPQLGFDGDAPYSKFGAPTVPPDQTVRVNLKKPATLEYVATAGPSVAASRWNVFLHHGFGYANDIFLHQMLSIARASVQAATIISPLIGDPLPSASDSFAAFYWKLRFFAPDGKDPMMERLKFDLEACRRL
jgi:hypothetical protein